MPNVNADIVVLRLHESVEQGFRAAGVTTVAALVRWLEAADRPRVPGVGATKITGLRRIVARWWAGDLDNGPGNGDPTPEEIKRRCAEVRRSWGPHRLPQVPRVEIQECTEGSL